MAESHRLHFQEELTRLEEQALGALDLVVVTLDRTLEALHHRDIELAAIVIQDDDRIDGRYLEVHQGILSLLALQAPVASDLRIVLSSIYCAEKIERMGDLAEHIASTTCRTHPDPLVPEELRPVFAKLGEVCAGMADRLVEHVARPRAGAFAELDEIDHEVDDLHAGVLREVTGPTWNHDVPTATGLALVARFYERYADQAVSVAKRVEFVRTGETPVHPAAR
jgi:phosphate transport system protein